MNERTVKLYHPTGPDRVAVVSCEPSSQDPSQALVRVARGKSANKLVGGDVYGPYAEPELTARFDQAVQQLMSLGFSESFASDLSILKDKHSILRAREAARLGRQKNKAAVPALIEALGDAVDDSCTIIDALGEIGDARAAEILRTYAARKLLSRRRSAVEALRKIGDAQGMKDACERARDKIPKELLAALDAGDVKTLTDEAMKVAKLGRVLDYLYELDEPVGNEAVRRVLGQVTLGKANFWRYAKSIYKRAMLRRDHATLGLLTHRIESQGRQTSGDKATVKSGYDGKKRSTPIFSKKTTRFLRRATWRHLGFVAHYYPAEYAEAAAHAIIHYTTGDEQLPRGAYGRYADCYALHRVIWGRSKRFELRSRNMKFRFRGSHTVKPVHGVREEAFSALWDAHPDAYLTLLGRSQLAAVHSFAVDAIELRHADLIQKAPADLLVGMLSAPHDPTVQLGLKELERRFDPTNPDWQLLDLLLKDERDFVRDHGHTWLRLCTSAWTADIERTIGFLKAPHGSTRLHVADLAGGAAPGLNAELRKRLAARVLDELNRAEPEPGFHAGLARFAEKGLSAELNLMVQTKDLLALINSGSEAAKALGGFLLMDRPSALHEIGIEGVVQLAENSMLAVRQAAAMLLRGAAAQLRDDPSVLFTLVESAWPDTRAAAFAILREEMNLAELGLDGLLGLCDSNRSDVQAVGAELVRKHLDALEPATLVYRLAEHPHPIMHTFALELAHAHLREGFVPLAKIEPLFRAILLNVWPSARDKKSVVEFLIDRGCADENQAEVAARVLSDFVQSHTIKDFEQALVGLAQIKLVYPDVSSAVTLPGGDA